MSELIIKYRIFVASPSDVKEERIAIEDVILYLNKSYGIMNNLVIELVKWETHSAPGISTSHSQDIINNDIGTYDLFIGIIWKRFGTPTKEYGSGTEEEFNIAYNRFLKDPKSLQILFYFKKSMFNFDDIDVGQIEKIKNFKSKLRESKVLSWDFDKKEDLQEFLKIHIPMRINDLRKTEIESDNIDKNTKKLESELSDTEELGLLDYIDMYEDSIETSLLALTRLSDATSWIGDEFNKHTNEINILLDSNQPISHKIQRNIYDKTSRVMNDYANRINPEINIYSESFETSVDAFSKMLIIYKNDYEGYEDQILEAKQSLGNLIKEIEIAIKGMSSFLHSITIMPRVTKEFNKARNNVVEKITKLISNLEVSITLAKEVIKNLD